MKNKILYINRKKSDYMQDILYSGLVKKLGFANVIDAPWNDKFHFNFKKYPKNIGYQKGTLISSLITRFTNSDFTLVIVASCHPDTLKQYQSILKTIPESVPTVFIDGGDWPEVSGDLDRIGGRELYEEICKVRPFDYIFKREMLIDADYADNIFPLTFGFNFDRIPVLPEEKKYDVAFWAVESHPIRTQALDLLQDKFDCLSNGTVRNQVMSKYKRKGDFYLQELSRCKISLNFRGAGWDTLRYWEVPVLGGFMITQKPAIRIDNDFIDGEEVVHCQEDLSDIVDLCNTYLSDEDKREKIAHNALKKMERYHTDKHRAEYVLKQCGVLVD